MNQSLSPQDISLYDTYERTLRKFEPINPEGEVGLYCCGPTVYDYAHIGNLRTYVFEDVLRRALETAGFSVRHVMNITDVGHLVSDADDGKDKMEAGAERTGKTAYEIADTYTAAFMSDIAALNIKTPHVVCKATDHIAEQISCIQTIADKGFTYITSDGVYFDTSKDPDYGYLARLDVEGLQAGARVSLGEKKQVTDFALWKFSPADEVRQMEWDSPWGKGFPGWHIECSAMASKYLGPLFDIHCGGKDHIPIHHANEIAQTHVCHGTRLANYWLHGYFLELDSAKMSKSSGEFLRMATLLEREYDPLSYRLLCLMAHYRSDISFSWETLDSAQTALNRLRSAYHSMPKGDTAVESYVERFYTLVRDDLNTAGAMAVVWELLKADVPDAGKRATLDLFDDLLGLELCRWQPEELSVPENVKALAEQRAIARTNKDWAEADRLRDELAALGFEVMDSASGPEIRKL